jgi:tetratricopeptide (TPR) repeat protein
MVCMSMSCVPSGIVRLAACLCALLCLIPGRLHAVEAPQRPAEAPPLPTLALEAFPAMTRDALQGPYQEAIARPDDADVVGRLGLVLHAWDERDAAAAAYARAQALAPTSLDWWYLGGLVANRRALPSEAVRHFQQAHRIAPDNILVALRLADAHLSAGEMDAAAALYDELATASDAAPAALYGLGRVRQAAGDLAGAREAFGRALALYPDFGAAHYALAQLQRRAGDLQAARASLQRQQQCLACWPMPPDPWRERIEAVRDDAGVLLQRGTAQASSTDAAAAADAIRLHEAAIERDPTLGQAHLNLITLYGRTGNIARAEAHYRAARDMPGFAADAHRAYGWLLMAQQKPQEALAAFEQAVALLPADGSALHGLGLAHEILDQPREASDAYARAVEAVPTAREVRFNLARSLVRSGRVPEAIAQLEQLRQPEDADTARYLFALAVAHVRAGDLVRGRQVTEEALAVAQRFELTDLAQTIAAELAKLPPQ